MIHFHRRPYGYSALRHCIEYEIERVEGYDRLQSPPSFIEWHVTPYIKGRGTFERLSEVRAALERLREKGEQG